jgi:hypothetical protein
MGTENTIPVSGVDELEKHLDELISDPTLPTNLKLFDDVELQITGMQMSPPAKNATFYANLVSLSIL